MNAHQRSARVAGVVSALLGVAGAILLVVALTSRSGPPQPQSEATSPSAPMSASHSSAAATPAPTTLSPSGRPRAAGTTASPSAPGLTLPRSAPTEVEIPAIGVQSSLLQLGLNPDHTVQVPPLNEKDSHAGWYKYSPTPGQLGPSVILGHVDSAKSGPAVFYRLGSLKPGDVVDVTRSDGTVAVFSVDRVAEFGKDDFPTQEVYGDIDHAGLRLITCGGRFDFSEGSYDDNIVVFASLVSAHPAK